MNDFQSKIKIIFASVLLCFSVSFVLTLAASSFAASSLPILLLGGDLSRTPQSITACGPLVVQCDVTNTGTAAVSSGILTIQIGTAVGGELVFSQSYRLAMGAQSLMINKALSPGFYTLTLKAWANNKEHSITRRFTLAEQALTISPPVLVKKGGSAVPRVLIWLGRSGTAVQQAFAEMIVKQAFEESDVYYAIVDSAEDFTNKFMGGDFNTAVLFESDELPGRFDWLQDRVARGQGLVIIGSNDRTRMIAETFGFTFSETPVATGAMLLLQEDVVMGLSGTIPVSGRLLLPQKKTAKPVALFAANKKAAVLIDRSGGGQVIVMPFSLTRSAVDAGTTSLYSLLLRSAVRNVAPEKEEQTDVSSIELLVSDPSGPIKARLEETLPPGTRVIWTNTEGTMKNNTIVYDLTVDNVPQKFLFLYRPSAGSKIPALTEVFYECGGKLVSQGKIE